MAQCRYDLESNSYLKTRWQSIAINIPVKPLHSNHQEHIPDIAQKILSYNNKENIADMRVIDFFEYIKSYGYSDEVLKSYEQVVKAIKALKETSVFIEYIDEKQYTLGLIANWISSGQFIETTNNKLGKYNFIRMRGMGLNLLLVLIKFLSELGLVDYELAMEHLYSIEDYVLEQ